MSFTVELFAQMSRRKRSKRHFALRGSYHFSPLLINFMGVLVYFVLCLFFVFMHTLFLKLQNVTKSWNFLCTGVLHHMVGRSCNWLGY